MLAAFPYALTTREVAAVMAPHLVAPDERGGRDRADRGRRGRRRAARDGRRGRAVAARVIGFPRTINEKAARVVAGVVPPA